MRGIVVLLLVALLLGGAVLAVYWGEWFAGKDPVREGVKETEESGLRPLETERVARIVISEGEEKVVLAKRDDTWILPERYDLPVMENRLNNLLKKLERLDESRLVGTRNPGHYELDEEGGRRLKVYDAEGTLLLDLLVGKQDSTGGGDRRRRQLGTYVMPAGGDGIYRVRLGLIGVVQTKPTLWREGRLITDMDAEEANDMSGKGRRVVLEFDDVPLGQVTDEGDEEPAGDPGRMRVVLESREAEDSGAEEDYGPVPPGQAGADSEERRWELVEPAASRDDVEVYSPFVDTLVRQLLFLRMDYVAGKDPEKPEYGLEDPMGVVTLELEDGRTYRLRVGAEAPMPEDDPRKNYKLRYAHLSGSPWVVRLNEHVLRQVFKKPEDFEHPRSRGGAPKGPHPSRIAIPGEGDGGGDDSDR